MQALDRPIAAVPARRVCSVLHPQGELLVYSAIAGRCPVVMPRAQASAMTRLLTLTRRNLRTWTTPERRRKVQAWVQAVQQDAMHHFEQAKSRLAA